MEFFIGSLLVFCLVVVVGSFKDRKFAKEVEQCKVIAQKGKTASHRNQTNKAHT